MTLSHMDYAQIAEAAFAAGHLLTAHNFWNSAIHRCPYRHFGYEENIRRTEEALHAEREQQFLKGFPASSKAAEAFQSFRRVRSIQTARSLLQVLNRLTMDVPQSVIPAGFINDMLDECVVLYAEECNVRLP